MHDAASCTYFKFQIIIFRMESWSNSSPLGWKPSGLGWGARRSRSWVGFIQERFLKNYYDGVPLDNVFREKYLGTIFTVDAEQKHDVKENIVRALVRCGKLRHILDSPELSLVIKPRLSSSSMLFPVIRVRDLDLESNHLKNDKWWQQQNARSLHHSPCMIVLWSWWPSS